MDEITLTHTCFVEKSKTSVFAISGSSKFHCAHKHSNTCHWINLNRKDLFFLNAPKNVLYENQ